MALHIYWTISKKRIFDFSSQFCDLNFHPCHKDTAIIQKQIIIKIIIWWQESYKTSRWIWKTLVEWFWRVLVQVRLLDRGGIADFFFWEHFALAICQKSWEPSFQDSGFISICKFGNFKKLFAMITNLPELYFKFNKESDFYELWQQPKDLENMEMSETWPDFYSEGYIHQFQLEPTHKIY